MPAVRTAVLALCFASAAALWVSCEDEPSALSLLGGGCRLNSDCEGGLICAYGVCREECRTSEDCEGGRCVLDARKVHFCQPAQAAACEFNSDCLDPLVCARDATCRNQCASDRDCVAGQVCSSATCAEPDELDADGKLPERGNALGRPCNYASDCGAEGDLILACRFGICSHDCFEDRDCGKYKRCSSADADTPGNCEFINDDPSLIVCDPLLDPPTTCLCATFFVEVPCNSQGTGYECLCP